DAAGTVAHHLLSLEDFSQADAIEAAVRSAASDGGPALDPAERWAARIDVGLARASVERMQDGEVIDETRTHRLQSFLGSPRALGAWGRSP
ncbi:MAG: hypothetical protein AAGI51_18615, partial [Pseudomonadota bacterium]